ncbi:MAG: RNA polymerase sigma factor [Treponemataceae bacterium]|nr:RNA polymerase sigma factor [Treponemataceae bacterium]
MAGELFRKLEHDFLKRRDNALVKSVLAGNKAAFARLMGFYKQRVFQFGRSFFHNDADSDDFVQDVFIKVYLHLASFEGRSLFSTWLMRIAYTTAVNAASRRKEYLPIADESALPSGGSSPEEEEIRRITQEAIRAAVRTLPEKYAVCIEMYFYYDIPYMEISEITGIPVNTIKSHIFRAKKLLKERLEEVYEK